MKKLGILVIAIVVATGSLGLGYSMWSQTVSISGKVVSGHLCVAWTTATNMDRGPAGPPYDVGAGNGDPNLDVAAITGNSNGWPFTGYPTFPADTQATYYFTDKNVASTNVTGLYTNTLLVTVNNGYPLYYNDLQVEFCNCGTIPVKLQSIVIKPLNFTLANQPWSDATYPSNGGQIWVTVTDGIGTQLDPGQCKAASVKFVVQESAQQNRQGPDLETGAYQFTITWTVVQWNEYSASSGSGD